jgi:hypothetical protein
LLLNILLLQVVEVVAVEAEQLEAVVLVDSLQERLRLLEFLIALL